MAFGRYENPRYPLNVGGKICRTKEEEDAQLARMQEANQPKAEEATVSKEDFAALLQQYETRGSRVAELDQQLGDMKTLCDEKDRQIQALHHQITELEAKLSQ